MNINKREVGDFVVLVALAAALLLDWLNEEVGNDEERKPELVDDDDGGGIDGLCSPRHIKYFSIVLTAANGSTLTGPPFH